jgi:multiple sugar transport system substrate-binding protein
LFDDIVNEAIILARPTRVEFNYRLRFIVDELRGQIHNGLLQPNSFLPSELKLGEQYKLNKQSVRHALDQLVHEGLVTKIRRVGNRVNEPSKWLAGKEGVELCASTSFVTESSVHTSQTVVRFAYHSTLLYQVPLQSLVDSFEQAHQGVQVIMIPTTFPFEFADHGLVDVFTITTWDVMKRWGQPGSLDHLTPITYEEAADPKLYDSFLNPSSADNENLIAMPFAFSPIVLCYNRTHFRECGLDEPDHSWTWYTLLKAALLITQKLDIWGFATHIQSINRWPVFLLQNGFRFRPEDPNWRASDDPLLWESLRVARDLIHKQNRPISLMTEDSSDAEQLFLEGKASMILTTYFGMSRFLESDLDYAIAPLPALSNADTLLVSTGLSIIKTSEQQELSRKFIEHLCSFESQAQIRRQTLTLPAHRQALALTDNLLGNRPSREETYSNIWSRCRHYADLKLDAHTMEAIRHELKSYWAQLEDEVKASERLGILFR